jgi:hypothetical protein
MTFVRVDLCRFPGLCRFCGCRIRSAQWLALAAADRLDESQPPRTITAARDGTAEITLELPMPGIAHLELSRA